MDKLTKKEQLMYAKLNDVDERSKWNKDKLDKIYLNIELICKRLGMNLQEPIKEEEKVKIKEVAFSKWT